MKKTTCSTKPVTLRQWLTCGMCWEVKAGLILLLTSKLLLSWGNPMLSSNRWKVGLALFWSAVAILLGGLVRDCWLIATTKFERASKERQGHSGGHGR